MGQLIPFPPRARRPYEPAALDRLVVEIDRRRGLRVVGEAEERAPRACGTVVPFRLADR